MQGQLRSEKRYLIGSVAQKARAELGIGHRLRYQVKSCHKTLIGRLPMWLHAKSLLAEELWKIAKITGSLTLSLTDHVSRVWRRGL